MQRVLYNREIICQVMIMGTSQMWGRLNLWKIRHLLTSLKSQIQILPPRLRIWSLWCFPRLKIIRMLLNQPSAMWEIPQRAIRQCLLCQVQLPFTQMAWGNPKRVPSTACTREATQWPAAPPSLKPILKWLKRGSIIMSPGTSASRAH